MRKELIIGNWKMNKTPSETKTFKKELTEELQDKKFDTEWAISAPFISLPALKHCEGMEIPLAAQNVHYEESGAYTGEISLKMLEDIDVKYAIIGHSERREMFAETNETVNKKVKATLKTNIIPVIAYGETEKQFESGETKSVITEQITKGLEGLSADEASKVVLAYEPIWAIGTGKTATPEQAQEMCKASREILTKMFGEDVSSKVRILYGGSMNPSNVKELIAQEDIDGGLVGGASLETKSWTDLLMYKN